MIDLTEFVGTDILIEAAHIAVGEPTETVAIAGLQYHGYGRDDGLGGIVEPRRGDRVQLVREPENPAHAAAVGIWWRNQHKLGHLPWQVAQDLAPLLDAGESVRAYLVREGSDSAWSASVLLVGEAVAAWAALPSPYAADDEEVF